MSKQKDNKFFPCLIDVTFFYDLQGKILDTNLTALELFGYTKEEILSLTFYDLIPLEFLEQLRNSFVTIKKKGFVEFKIEFVKKNGEVFPAEVSLQIFEIHSEKVIHGILRVIVDQNRVEETLRASEEKYRTILENIEDSYYEVNLAGKFTFFNKNLPKILGYTENEVLGMSYREYCSESVAEKVLRTFNNVYQSGKPEKEFELEYRKKNGTIGYSEVSVSLIVDSTGKKQGFRGIIRDITERRKADIALQEAKEKYQMLIDKMEEGVVLEDSQGFLTFANPRATNLLGYKEEEELIGRHWSEFIAPECLGIVRKETGKRILGISSRYETIALGKKGKRIPIIISAAPLQTNNDGFKGVLAVFTDISQLKKVELKLRKSEKRIQRIKLEEERYYDMLTHFLNNDLQKILLGLDLIIKKYISLTEFDYDIVKQLMKIINNSSRNIELVNKIFAVLQAEVSHITNEVKILELISNIINNSHLSSPLKKIEVNESILSIIILKADKHLYDVFYELLQFIVGSGFNDIDINNTQFFILIDASLDSSNLCIRIRDNNSQPISQLLSTELISSITEKWESRGHYLPIALASVIMKYYGGELRITPLDNGNIFELLFPLKMIIT